MGGGWGGGGVGGGVGGGEREGRSKAKLEPLWPDHILVTS